MEKIIVSLLENSIVGGAFVFLLWHVTNTFERSLKATTEELKRVTKVLTRMDIRMESLEKRMEIMEKERNDMYGNSR